MRGNPLAIGLRQVSENNGAFVRIALALALTVSGGCSTAGTRTGATGEGGSVGSGSGGGTMPVTTGGGGSTTADASGGGSDGPTSSVDAIAPTTDGPNCGLTTFALEREPPDVLIVLDKSQSMSEFTTLSLLCLVMQCNSKWVDMTNALTTTVTKTQGTVNWGIKLFPTDDSCGVMDGVAAPVAENNAAAVIAAMKAEMPSGATPTRLAIQGAGQYLMSLTRSNPRYIVLATDGLPNCAGARMNDADDAATIMAVSDVAAAGIPTFVIGVGTQGGADATLSAMAKAGGKPRATDPAYYPVTTADDLTAALETIGGQIVSCTLPIKQPPDPTNIAVDADGARVPHNDTDGWAYGAGMTSIQLRGSWCTNYQNGTIKNVKAIFGCPGLIIP